MNPIMRLAFARALERTPGATRLHRWVFLAVQRAERKDARRV